MLVWCPKALSAPRQLGSSASRKAAGLGCRRRHLDKLKIRHEVTLGSYIFPRELERQNIFRQGLPQVSVCDSGIRASGTWQEP